MSTERSEIFQVPQIDRSTLHRRTVALTQAVATVAIQGGKPENEVLRIAGIYDHWIETGRTPAETAEMHRYLLETIESMNPRPSSPEEPA